MSPLWGAGPPALLAGLVVAFWLTGPAEELSRVTHPGRAVGPSASARSLLPPPRPDALPLPRRVLVAAAGAVAAGLALRSVGGVFEQLGWAVMPVLTLGGVLVLGRLEPGSSRRRRQRLVWDLPQALELLSACLAAGMPLRQATSAVAGSFDGPVGEDLGHVLSLVDLGVSDAEAWRHLRAHPQWGPAAVDVARSAQSGTMLVNVLAQHARDGRARRRAAMEVRAKSVGVRSVLPLMTCFLPAFMLLGVVPTVASAVLHALF